MEEMNIRSASSRKAAIARFPRPCRGAWTFVGRDPGVSLVPRFTPG